MTSFGIIIHVIFAISCLNLELSFMGKVMAVSHRTLKSTGIDVSRQPQVTDPGGGTSSTNSFGSVKVASTPGSLDNPSGEGPSGAVSAISTAKPRGNLDLGYTLVAVTTNQTANSSALENQGVTENYTLYGSLHSYFDPKYYYDMVQDYRSRDAFWGMVCLCFLVGLLLFIVWCSRMWRTRNYTATSPQEAQRLQQQNWVSLVDLLQSKFKYLPRKLRNKLTKKRQASRQKTFDAESDWHIIEDEDCEGSEAELLLVDSD